MSKNRKRNQFLPSKKNKLLRLIISLSAGCACLLVVMYFFAGTEFGMLYDFLLEYRTKKPTSAEIVLIETGGSKNGNVISSQAVSSLVLTLTELEARSLLLEVPVLGVSSGGFENDSDLLFLFNDEFGTISGNIKNLFDGIRTGSISPEQASAFVNDVLTLTDQSKNKLLSAAFKRDTELILELDKTLSAFGSVFIPSDISVDVINTNGFSGSPGVSLVSPFYTEVPASRDGIVRRIPLKIIDSEGNEFEHITFGALKSRLDNSDITELYFDTPGQNDKFKILLLADFLDYSETDKMLYRVLSEAAGLAQYSGTVVENYPPFLYEKSANILNALLANPSPELKNSWIESRNNYFNALDIFFNKNKTEDKIKESFGSLITDEMSNKKIEEKINAMETDQMSIYIIAKELYKTLSVLRTDLQTNLSGSFCIAGAFSNSNTDGAILKQAHLSSAEISALAANSLLSKNYILPVETKFVLLWSFLTLLVILFAINGTGFLLSLISGLCMTILAFLAFSYSFVITSYWINPVIPASSVLCGSVVSSFCALVIKHTAIMYIRRTMSPFVPKKFLTPIIFSGSTLIHEDAESDAVIVVVRNAELSTQENFLSAMSFAAEQKKFRKDAVKIFFEAGAVLAGCTNDTLIFAFGSPLHSLVSKYTKDKQEPVYAKTACETVKSLYKSKIKKGLSMARWKVGMDFGKCVFYYSVLSGYYAAGSNVMRARVLATLTTRHKADVLISKNVAEKIDAKFYMAVDQDETPENTKDLFFELITK
ncbi:MAG: hypothetical protein LBV52_01245 [Spirochaetaceae bacterium]|jgi:hypothetical protein|nr:hypothetical protein [Spirochaetaceae bacterium]